MYFNFEYLFINYQVRFFKKNDDILNTVEYQNH